MGLSPVTLANNCPLDSDTNAVYGLLVDELAARKIAFIHFIEGNTQVEHSVQGFDFAGARQRFGGAYIANNGYSHGMALQAVDSGAADAVAFGRQFLANPDLPKRLMLNAPLNAPNPKTYYGPGAVGYTDYPAL